MASGQSAATKAGHALAKGLRIDLRYRNPTNADELTRGESVFSAGSADQYIEEEPHVGEWMLDQVPSPREVGLYFYSLFPFLSWIGMYNVQWLIGDLVAGITVGAVVVPQGMAYALLANLPAQYGLYSSFMGVLVYWFFATSKDITIGPVAVLSTVVGNVITAALQYDKTLNPAAVANALSIIAGGIVCFLGLTRLGWFVNFISLAAISAYMTGSALNIAVGQVPTLLGESGFSSRDSTYLVIIHSLQYLRTCKLDAAIGLTGLFLLYFYRWLCNFLARKFPNHKRTFFFVSTLRTVFVILLYTLISWRVNLPYRVSTKFKFKILGDVPRGFVDAHVPFLDKHIIQSFLPSLPVTVIVMLIEHIAIAKSFGRVNNYTINPSQELVAIGITNLLGPFLGAYPATGSFSRTAIKSKAGVRTPLAGVITALVVLLAVYALPPVFYYIPNATLSAVIIHAVGDLITPPSVVYQFWLVSPLDVVIFFAGVLVTVFSSIENGIYTTICVSVAVLLWRKCRSQGRFLGPVKVHSVLGDHVIDGSGNRNGHSRAPNFDDPDTSTRNVFLPLEAQDGSNPEIQVEKPYPGIFIFRFAEGFNYPNATHELDEFFVRRIFKETRRTNPDMYPRLGDRPWNDAGKSRSKPPPDHSDRPELKAVILDFSSVNNVDITSVQNLIDIRNQLDRYASPKRVDWHFANITSRWTKRALASAGFGYPAPPDETGTFQRWKPIFSVAEIGGDNSPAADAERETERRNTLTDLEKGGAAVPQPDDDGIRRVDQHEANPASPPSLSSEEGGLEHAKRLAQSKAVGRQVVLHGLSRPLFHVDLTSALQSAIANVEKEEVHTEIVGPNK